MSTFRLRREAPSAPAQVPAPAPARATVPARPVAPAKPAPPAPVPVAEPDPGYSPRDPVFFALAVSVIAASLQPIGFDETDRDQAEDTAGICAQILDGGPVPDGFLVPWLRNTLNAAESAELVDAAANSRILPGRAHAPAPMTAAQIRTERERLSKLGPLKSREDIAAENDAILSQFADLSEPVRMAALFASAIRIAPLREITGAREDEAVGIVCAEIERAIRVHDALDLPTRSADTEAANEREPGPEAMPYPASMLAGVIAGVVARATEPPSEPEAK